MRGHALLIALLSTFATVGSLGLPAAPVDARDVELLPADFPDAALVLLLASTAGYDVHEPTGLVLPDGVTLPGLVYHMGMRARLPIAPEDVAPFATLDARIAEPVALLLYAMDHAWTLRDQAFAGLTRAEQVELVALAMARDGPRGPRESELAAKIDAAFLLQGAIDLLDAAETIAIPALQQAARDAPWPATAIADPVGVLRIGGTGDDSEILNRILQIDPRGNDLYWNNAGATTVIADLDPLTPDYNIAMSIDFEGNDFYHMGSGPTQGGAVAGIGILYDFEGNEAYYCEFSCQGADIYGHGYLRDKTGNDDYFAGARALAHGEILAILRDDAGDDNYRVASQGGGYVFDPESTALLWDRRGHDNYTEAYWIAYGWGDKGRGWLVDEGPEVDYHASAHSPAPPEARHGCNDCEWTIGTGYRGGPVRGGGQDGPGGLVAIIIRLGLAK